MLGVKEKYYWLAGEADSRTESSDIAFRLYATGFNSVAQCCFMQQGKPKLAEAVPNGPLG